MLFMDIVAYSQLPMNDQTRLIELLQQIVRTTAEFGRAQKRRQLLRLPTGDGMALVFFGDAEAPVRCALEISRAVRDVPDLNLRMGIHTGPVQRVEDINANRNVAGGGINLAQRVMDCADPGHILLSGAMADLLLNISNWSSMLHDLGEVEVKHAVRIRVYSLHNNDFGNAAVPQKIRDAARRPWVWVASLVLLLLLAGTYLVTNHKSRLHADGGTHTAATSGMDRILQYGIIVQKEGDKLSQGMAVNGQPIFASTDRVRLVFSSPQAGYLYIVNEGPASTLPQPVFNSLFPSPSTNQGSALLSPSRELTIPEHSAFVFDKTGIERMWLVWSKETIPEMEALKKWVNQQDRGSVGDPGERLWLESFLTNSVQLRPEPGRDGTVMIHELRGKGDVLVYLIKLEHQ